MSNKTKGKKASMGKVAKKGPAEQNEDEVPQAVVCRAALGPLLDALATH
jgi:hypothetical protein